MARKKAFDENPIAELKKLVDGEIPQEEPVQQAEKPVKAVKNPTKATTTKPKAASIGKPKATASKPKTSAKAEKPKAVAAEQPQEAAEKPKDTADKPKKPVGRPKTRGDYKLVNVAIPVATYDRMKTASALLGNNMTAYILGLVYDDLNANKNLYDEIEQVLLKSKK